MIMMPEITIEPLRRIMKSAGARRVSDSAALELSLALEQKALRLLEEANRLSKHAGRRTVMKQDVRLARKSMRK